MLSWLRLNSDAKAKATPAQVKLTDRLAKLYSTRVLPLERDFLFDKFYSPSYTDATFSAKPMVLMLGQYSTGKTTFIRHLIGREYPGSRIGPEPTTDKFVIVTAGSKDRSIPGNAVVVDPSMPFTQLSSLGNGFLQKLECVQLKGNDVIDGITIIDTPGVLSGEKQTLQRNYDFNACTRWFADNADLIIILFDANKLDIFDEFKQCIAAIKHNQQKIRIVLNKADGVSSLHLMQVFGAMMWSLGKMLDTPEIPRVYLGSFWDKPLQNSEYRALFEAEQTELFKDLAGLPRTASLNKLNELVRRARMAKNHAFLMNHMWSTLPAVFGKQAAQAAFAKDLKEIAKSVAEKNNLNLGDFPPLDLLKPKLASFDFNKLGKFKEKDVKALDTALNDEIPKLLLVLTKEDEEAGSDDFLDEVTHASPFTQENSYREHDIFARIPNADSYADDFNRVGPDAEGRLTGLQAKSELIKSNLPSMTLHKIWQLADINRDGFLDLFEYAVARELVNIKMQGFDLPREIPASWIVAKDQRKRRMTVSGIAEGSVAATPVVKPASIGALLLASPAVEPLIKVDSLSTVETADEPRPTQMSIVVRKETI